MILGSSPRGARRTVLDHDPCRIEFVTNSVRARKIFLGFRGISLSQERLNCLN